SKTSPVQFEIPNRTGAVLQVQGRGANVNDLEGPAALSTLTRWLIGGGGQGDMEAPPQPVFALSASALQSGTVELSGVGFSDFTNTHSITAGTLTLYYWNELAGDSTFSLASPMSAADALLTLSAPGTAPVGSFVQIDAEVMQVTGIPSQNGGN